MNEEREKLGERSSGKKEIKFLCICVFVFN